AERVGAATAIARKRPASMLPIAGGIVLKPTATWPPTRSFVSGPVPLYDTSQADSGRTLEGTDPTIDRSFAWERAHLRRNPGMNFVMTLGVVLAGFWFDAAMAQEGYFGHDHDKWHHGFYQTLERPDTKSPCCNLTDCRPTSGRQVDGHYEVKVNGEPRSLAKAKPRTRQALVRSRPAEHQGAPAAASARQPPAPSGCRPRYASALWHSRRTSYARRRREAPERRGPRRDTAPR